MTARIALFDLGGVLLDWSPARLYSQVFSNAAEADRFLAEVCTMAWHLEHDRGVSFADNAAPLIDAGSQRCGRSGQLLRASVLGGTASFWQSEKRSVLGALPALKARCVRRPSARLNTECKTWSAVTLKSGGPMLSKLNIK